MAEITKTFMHELWHNLGLDHSTDPDGSDPDPGVNPWPGKETIFDTVMFLDLARQTNLII
ncbi:MAG: hypothetical protein H5T44_05710 [Thermoplasmatales archaeon]|nr:hypothetical protein [Thermoplasmatales archaeon]